MPFKGIVLFFVFTMEQQDKVTFKNPTLAQLFDYNQIRTSKWCSKCFPDCLQEYLVADKDGGLPTSTASSGYELGVVNNKVGYGFTFGLVYRLNKQDRTH